MNAPPPPVYAVLGRPVGRSRSPAIHTAWLRALDLPGTYVALEVPPGREDGVVDAIRALGLAGCNVTLPLKERVARQLDALRGPAARTGAANTVIREGGRLVGDNTDVGGCLSALREAGLDPGGASAVVVGAGGAARAAVEALRVGGAARIGILARDPAAAGALLALAPDSAAIAADLAGAELVIHATSGRPDALVRLAPDDLPRLAGWMDLNYWDPDPPGRGAALARGAVFVDGWPMFVAQAAASFAAWTGRDPLTVLRPARVW